MFSNHEFACETHKNENLFLLCYEFIGSNAFKAETCVFWSKLDTHLFAWFWHFPVLSWWFWGLPLWDKLLSKDSLLFGFMYLWGVFRILSSFYTVQGKVLEFLFSCSDFFCWLYLLPTLFTLFLLTLLFDLYPFYYLTSTLIIVLKLNQTKPFNWILEFTCIFFDCFVSRNLKCLIENFVWLDLSAIGEFFALDCRQSKNEWETFWGH